MYLVRILIIGDSGVGKTSLLIRFNDNNFTKNQKSTIGVDYKAKELIVDEETIKLQIWDTAGQERFRSLTSAFYSKAQGVIVTFDVNQRESFQALVSWIRDVRTIAPEYCQLIIAANKTDVPMESWSVKREEFTAFALENNLILMECSAATGDNVTEIFTDMSRQILHNIRHVLTQVDDALIGERSSSLFNLTEETNGRQNRCCVIS